MKHATSHPADLRRPRHGISGWSTPARVCGLTMLLLPQMIYGADGASASRAASSRVIEVDLSKPLGGIRPLHGVNCGPIAEGFTLNLSRYFRALQVPYVRLHSPNFPSIDCVHVEDIFPDMAADPDDPASYNFQRTDDYITAVLAVGAKPIYCLSPGNNKHVLARDFKPVNSPPADPKKWARVCLNITRHYNEGWADGFRHDIKHWEIWNEPDARNFWNGTVEQYADLYATIATELKRHDPKLKVGGPALSHNLSFLERFLALCQKRKLPLDFCSWHCYAERPVAVLQRAAEVQRLLERYGFVQAENQLNEWSPCPRPFQDMRRDPFLAREFFERTGSNEGGAFDASVLCFLQDSPVTMATFYSGDTLRWGFIDRNGAPKTSYFAFLAFRRMLDTPRRVVAEGNVLESGLAVLAGLSEDNSQARILISNHSHDCTHYDIGIRGLPWQEPTTVTRYVVDQHTDINRYDLAATTTNLFPAGDSLRMSIPATDKSVCLLELAAATKRR